ncbi:MAG: hypothetical protein Q8844_00765 [Pigeon pea little leaf phytoplasma]|nr:hypothetical protein [Pigeon pea little leaf phytoplasma]
MLDIFYNVFRLLIIFFIIILSILSLTVIFLSFKVLHLKIKKFLTTVTSRIENNLYKINTILILFIINFCIVCLFLVLRLIIKK